MEEPIRKKWVSPYKEGFRRPFTKTGAKTDKDWAEIEKRKDTSISASQAISDALEYSRVMVGLKLVDPEDRLDFATEEALKVGTWIGDMKKQIIQELNDPVDVEDERETLDRSKFVDGTEKRKREGELPLVEVGEKVPEEEISFEPKTKKLTLK